MPPMLKKSVAAIVALALVFTMAIGIVFASPNAQTGERPESFEFLNAVLEDANDKGVLSDAVNEALADLFIEYLIAPQTGETIEQVDERLSVEGQSAFQFLTAALADASDKGALSDAVNEALADLFIEYLIAPQTGETVEQARGRLSAQPTADDDRAALTALYNDTDGPNWSTSTNWLTDSPIGEWYGVSVDIEGRVTSIELAENQLSGEIPSELGNLYNLQSLDLGRNDLEGKIPAELSNLTNLTWLSLSGNQLIGEIPVEELVKLPNLKTLWLGDNLLEGEIPLELGNMAKLKTLGLGGNELTGQIPSELGSLTKLTRLYLGDNQLSGEIPSELGSLTNLWALGLDNNQLSGEIPSEFGNLTNLGKLFLGGNQLTGEIPSEFGNLTNLEKLFLGGNQLTGCIPEGLRDVEGNDLNDLGLFICGVSAQGSPEDRAALTALYNDTDGPNWSTSTNWLTDSPLNQWYGVSLDIEGRVAIIAHAYPLLSGV